MDAKKILKILTFYGFFKSSKSTGNVKKTHYVMSIFALCIFISPVLAKTVNVYSYRRDFLVKPLFDAFTEKTGIKVRMVYASKGLIERAKTEGRNTQADVIMTVDVADLSKIKRLGLAQSVVSKVLEQNIPPSLHDKDHKWFGLSMRSRVIYASKTRVKKGEISQYADLMDKKWKGRICMRSATHKYNVGLTAYMIARYGEQYTLKWLEGLKRNLARAPTGADRAQVKGVYEGICDIAIANDYYYGKMLANKDQKPWAEAVNIIWPDQAGNGVHVNMAGIALMKYAPHKVEGIKLMEFLSSPEAQEIYTRINNEHPVNPKVGVSEKVKSWYKDLKTLKIDTTVSLQDVVDNTKAAIMLINSAGLNQ